MNQNQITQPGPLLDSHGHLAQVGWARQPLLDCNLEQAAFYPAWKRFLQPIRVKRWDYYAFFTPRRFFSATIADLGYAANVFVYVLDFATDDLHEEGKIALASSVRLPRNSGEGVSTFQSKDLQMEFRVDETTRRVKVDWPAFNNGRGIHADLCLVSPPEHESMTIVIPIAGNRFYYNRKINCLPAEGVIQYGTECEVVDPHTTVGSLDWGRGVWEYSSFWNWASTSGFLADGRTIGFNLGTGFGDTSRATENALILDGKIHKLGFIPFDYTPGEYMKPWRFRDDEGRLDLTFTPFKERVATSNLLVIVSEVHQMFGRYSGKVIADNGEVIEVDGLVGFAEEHHAKW
jgi:hypothetical protein